MIKSVDKDGKPASSDELLSQAKQGLKASPPELSPDSLHAEFSDVPREATLVTSEVEHPGVELRPGNRPVPPPLLPPPVSGPFPDNTGRGSRAIVWVLAGILLIGAAAATLMWSARQIDSDVASPTTSIEVSATLPLGDPYNVALRNPVKAPGSYQSSPSAFVDGDYSSSWNSGGFPRQWIEVDLTAPSTITTIRLLTGQSPAGETVHTVLGWGPGETKARVLHVFDGATRDKQWLRHTPSTPWQNVQFIRIETTASPSWVAWFEFEAIGWTK